MATTEDLQARLRTAVSDGDRKISFILGAGMSHGIVPGVDEMINYFIEELPKSERKNVLAAVNAKASAIERYQTAAEMLLVRGGNRRVRNALCKATLSGCKTDLSDLDAMFKNLQPDELRNFERGGVGWVVNKAHQGFANFYAELRPEIRGSIFTTNFDPLLEVSLATAGIVSEPLPISGTAIPTREQLDEKTATPVFHLHGYWRSSNSLHTVSQLERARPAVEQLVRQSFSNSLVVAIGYGGWNDVFMRALRSAVSEGQLYESELCWSVYSANENSIQGNPLLSDLRGIPDCNFYFGVDASSLFDIEFEHLGANEQVGSNSEYAAPDGFTILDPSKDLTDNFDPTRIDLNFVDGHEPDWYDAVNGAWPELASTSELFERANATLETHNGCVAAIGPIGEG